MAKVIVGHYVVDSELITFLPDAPPELAGKTERRWFVEDGPRKVRSGLTSQAEAVAAAVQRIADATPASVQLVDGRTVVVPAVAVERFAGLDGNGDRVFSSEVGLYAVTPCCQASATGSAGSPTGVACRGCYRPIGAHYGGPATVQVPVARDEPAEPVEDAAFAAWLARVDKLCTTRTGLSIHDLPDAPFADWHEDGISPAQAVRLAIANT